ncbi:MAG TPA: metallophosphoesterase [Candidatus Nitrosotenuis sp.]|jgi:hypothetical protein|nr:metallophosphoesterase [Candidatus Nitrosotenuis sp.]
MESNRLAPAQEGAVADKEVEGAPAQSEGQAPEAPPQTRKLVAVGDLHGDYHRLLRHLRENELLLPGTLEWNPAQNRVDLILIGDYVDWRGEHLEGPDQLEEQVKGAYRILELILSVHRQLERLRATEPGFDSHLYALLGNHDDMMLEATQVFEFLGLQELESLLGGPRHYGSIKRQTVAMGLSPAQVEKVLKLMNWWVQGGEATVRGFGGLRPWKEAMDGELGDFLRRYLRLGVILDDTLFVHTLPDSPRFWRPLEEIVALPEPDYRHAKELFLWSRKLWGYDYATGMRTSPFTPEELNALLDGFGVKRCVVGHTPLGMGARPVALYQGKILNIDLHGVPDAMALVEEYVPTGEVHAPLRPVPPPASQEAPG